MSTFDGNVNPACLPKTEKLRAQLFGLAVLLVLLMVVGASNANLMLALRDLPNLRLSDLAAIGYWLATFSLVFVIFIRFEELQKAKLLDRSEAVTTAEIQRRWEGHTSYYVNYMIEFTYLDEFIVQTSIPSRYYHRVRPGDEIKVIYLPNQPHLSRLVFESFPERDEPIDALSPTSLKDRG